MAPRSSGYTIHSVLSIHCLICGDLNLRTMNAHIASAQSVKIRKILDMIALNQAILNRSIELRWNEDEQVRNYHRIVINNRKLIDKRLIKYCKSQIRKLYVYSSNI